MGGLAAGASQRPACDSASRSAGRPDEVSARLKVRRMQGVRLRLGGSGLRSVSSPNLSLARTLAALLLSVQCGVVSCVSSGRPCRRCLCRRSVKAGGKRRVASGWNPARDSERRGLAPGDRRESCTGHAPGTDLRRDLGQGPSPSSFGGVSESVARIRTGGRRFPRMHAAAETQPRSSVPYPCIPWSLARQPSFRPFMSRSADPAALRSGNRLAASRRHAREFPARRSRSFAKRRPGRAKIRSTTSTGYSERPACRCRARGFGPEHPPPSAKVCARARAALITSGAPSRSCTPAGCTFTAIGHPSTFAAARRLRPGPSCRRHSPSGAGR